MGTTGPRGGSSRLGVPVWIVGGLLVLALATLAVWAALGVMTLRERAAPRATNAPAALPVSRTVTAI